MVFSATASADPNSRFEKSLALLTSRFMALLQSSPTGVLNLQEAAEDMKIRGRRMYDITNVLEGVGLIEKVGKKCIRWKGAVARQDLSQEELNAAAALKKEIETLNEQEKLLDMQLAMEKQDLAYTSASSGRHSYVHFQDLCQAFEENTILAVKAPNNTDMNISESDVYLNAMSGRIEVIMVEKDWDGQILASSIPLENQVDTFECTEDLKANGVYDPKFSGGETFVGGYEPQFTLEEAFNGGYDSLFAHEETSGGGYDSRLTHEEAFGYDFNHGQRLNEVSAERTQSWSCGVDNNDLVELDVLMKAVQDIQAVDSTEIQAVSNAEEVAASNSFSHINVIQEFQAVDNTENENVNSFSHIKVIQEIAPADNIEKGAVNNSSVLKAAQEIDIHAVGDSEKEAAANSFSYIKVVQEIQAVDNTEFVNSSSPIEAAQEIYVENNIEKYVQEIHANNLLKKNMIMIDVEAARVLNTRNFQVKTDALIKKSTNVENNPAQISPDQVFGVLTNRGSLSNIEPSFHDGSKVGDDVNRKADDFEFNQEPFDRENAGIFHDEGGMKRSVIVKNVAFSCL